MCVLFITPLITWLMWLVGRLGTRYPVDPHQLDGFFPPSDRHKSVRNRSVIEGFGGVNVLSIGC